MSEAAAATTNTSGIFGGVDGSGGGSGSGGNSGNAQALGSGAGAGTQGTGQSAGTQTGKAGVQSWRDSLPEDIRANPSLLPVENVETLAKSYIHAQSLIGKKGVFPPGDKASPEDWGKFYDSLGRPAKDKYEIKPSDKVTVDPKVLEGFKEQAYNAGLMPQKAQEMLNWYAETTAAQAQAAQAEKQTQAIAQQAGLKQRWGEGYDKELARADLALTELGPEAAPYIKHLQESGLSKDVKLIELFNLMAKKYLKEDQLKGEAVGSMGQTPNEIEEELAKMWAHPAMTDKNHREHQIIVNKMGELNRKKLRYAQKTG